MIKITSCQEENSTLMRILRHTKCGATPKRSVQGLTVESSKITGSGRGRILVKFVRLSMLRSCEQYGAGVIQRDVQGGYERTTRPSGCVTMRGNEDKLRESRAGGDGVAEAKS